MSAAVIWQNRVDGWARTGLSCKAYAAKIGVNPNTLAGWRRDAAPRSSTIAAMDRVEDRVKLLWWDHNGYAVLYKRLHRATTRPPRAPDPSMRALEIDVGGLAALMRGVDRPPRGGAREIALDLGAKSSSKGV